MIYKDKFLKEGVDYIELARQLSDYIYNESPVKKCVFPDEIGRFFEQPITPTLTEDERVILRNIKNEEYKNTIGRENNTTYQEGKLYLRSKYSDAKAFAISTLYNHLFQFIKNGEEYSIEELLEGK